MERVNLQDINEYLTNELRAAEMAIQQLQELVGTYETNLKTEADMFNAKVDQSRTDNEAELARLKARLAEIQEDIDRIQAGPDTRSLLPDCVFVL